MSTTARVLAEVRSQRISQLSAARSACNEAIVRCTSEEELFPKICEAAVTQGGVAMAWVGLIDGVSGQVRPVAWFGAGADDLAAIEVSVDANSPTGRGPTGWAASVGLALTRGGRPAGALTVYACDANFFDCEGRRLLTEMATDVSFALDAFARNAERVQVVEELRRAVRDKEALLRELHHRVKNNLQVITSMVRLESSRSIDAPVKAVLRDMGNRILSMALLHEMLCRSGDLAEVDLSVYLAQLSTQLIRTQAPSSGRITLRLNLAPASVGLDDAINCGLLVNELVANAINHAFADGRSGEVTVSSQLVAAGQGLRITVADTGIGLPADFESRRATSLGLQFVSDLARQLRGTVEIGPGPGARFALVFTPALPPAPTETV